MHRITIETEAEDASIAGLRSTECILRDRLRQNPTHNETRVRLAWCLFAIAGWEANHWRSCHSSVQESLPDPSRAILEESLRHANVAMQLSCSADERGEVELLRSLAERVGGAGLIRAVDREVASRVDSLSREIRANRRIRGGRLLGRQTRRPLVRHGRQD